MALVLFITVFLYFVSRFGGSHGIASGHPVCVIGAGLSGLNLGILLQEKGYNVHVFEKLPRVGGKVDTFTIRDEVLVEMGPIFYYSKYTSFLRYIEKFELTSVAYNQTDSVYFDPRSGTVLPNTNLTDEQKMHFKLAVERYAAYRSEYESQLDFGYLNATSDIFDPINTWLTNKNLTILATPLTILLTGFGYGSLQDTPALYMLKFITVELLSGNSSWFTLKEGLSALVNKMASGLINLHLNHELIGLIRNNDHQIINLRNGNSIKKEICGKTILALPPLLRNLEKVISDLNIPERSVLEQVKIIKLATAAHHIPPVNHNIYNVEGLKPSSNGTSPIGHGEVISFAKQSSKKTQNVYSSYSWIRGDFDAVPTDLELREMSAKMDSTFRKMSTRPKTLNPIRATEYFPHAPTDSLKNGFYQKLAAIQGNGGLYFASTILTFEDMDEALKMTESFVKKYFNASVKV